MKDIAVITGGSKGIGLAIAKRLVDKYKVFSLARTYPKEWNIYSYRCDITDPKCIKETMADIKEVFGTPNLLINCAGHVEPKSILEMTPEEWEYTIKVNLTGAFLCTQQFVRYLRRTGSPGKIINIASTAGTRPSPGWSAYAAAKAGLINFSLTMSEELRPYGIKVYCICPGRCATDLRRKLAPDEDQSRIMQPEEVADIVYYLATQDNVLDGQAITVKGGRGIDIS